MPTQQFIDAVKSAAEESNWYAALALALAMPDICGRVENPTFGSKQRYVGWWDKYLLSRYSAKVGPLQILNVFLSGNDAYALRCSFLHEGSDDPTNQKAKEALEKFHFIEPSGRGHFIHLNLKRGVLQLQVDRFCQDICDGAAQWIKDVADNKDVQSRMNTLLVIHKSSDEGGLVRVVNTT
jgi:hypothetical protein